MNGSKTRQPIFVHRCFRSAERALRDAKVVAQPVLLAVSGGSDSMALLEIVAGLAATLDLTMQVGCIDHGLRAEAGAEQQLVRAAAARHGAQFHARSIDPGRGDESTLRRQRHRALREIAAAAGCRFILLGHTADDQIETMLLRFLRGAGPGGLAGMRALRGPFVRPLLGLRRAELRRLLALREVGWAEDASNLSERYARGRLRTAVLPAIEAAFGRGAIDHLLDVAPRWRADDDYIEAEALRLLAYASRRGGSGPELDVEALESFPASLRSRALRAWIRTVTGRTTTSRELSGLERWLGGAARRGSVDVAGATVERRRGRLVLVACDSSGGAGAKSLSNPGSRSVDIPASSDDRSKALRGSRRLRR